MSNEPLLPLQIGSTTENDRQEHEQQEPETCTHVLGKPGLHDRTKRTINLLLLGHWCSARYTRNRLLSKPEERIVCQASRASVITYTPETTTQAVLRIGSGAGFQGILKHSVLKTKHKLICKAS